jgi:hypothetical protein
MATRNPRGRTADGASKVLDGNRPCLLDRGPLIVDVRVDTEEADGVRADALVKIGKPARSDRDTHPPGR